VEPKPVTRKTAPKEEDDNEFSFKELLMKSTNYLPMFAVFLIISFAVALVYIHFQTPLYSTSIKLLLNDASKKGSSGSTDEIMAGFVGAPKINMANEQEVLKSVELMERVVLHQQLNTVYYSVGKVNTLELFATKPESKFINFYNIKDSSRYYSVTIQVDKNGGIYELEGNKKLLIKNHVPVVKNGFTYVPNIVDPSFFNPDYEYRANWIPTSVMAGSLAGSLSIYPLSKDATVLVISTTSQVPAKAQVVLNSLAAEYNQYSTEQNNRIADNTIQFIDDRLLMVANELGDVETSLENFKRENNSVDITMQGTADYSKALGLEDKLDDQALQANIADMVISYIGNSQRRYQLVPSTLNISDATVAALIGKYNEGVLQRDQMLKTLGEKNIAVSTLESGLDSYRAKIIEAINNIKISYQKMDSANQRKHDELLTQVSAVPAKEKKLLEIERQQGIKEKLYLYLLEKREESAITRAAVGSKGTAVDAAYSYGPINFKNSNIYLMALFAGLGLPLLIVYLMDLLNDKLTTRQELLKLTEAPLVGEIGHFADQERKIVAGKSRGMLPEQFRIIRTNLRYFLEKEKRSACILVTSTMPGEGKTFTSINLAAVLAAPGKRTILIEFDMRKPKLAEALGMPKSKDDLAAFLAEGFDPAAIIRKVDNEENLYVITTSIVPPNPAELLLSDKIQALFTFLRANFDYIVVDTPPLGIVSDAKVLSEYADVCLYVIRQRYTQRKQVKTINDIYLQKRLPNLALVVNDVKARGIRGYYGYSYYSGGSYGYDYSFGYNYGGSGPKRSLWQKLKGFFK
jgi:capsular exopolysaccharide synthesis family protein